MKSMPRIENAQEAIEVAQRFVRKYHNFVILKRASKQQGNWVVEFDVGLLNTDIRVVKLDGDSGNVIEYGPAK